ncbi:MAG: helical backbone metal receptor [Lachnospiraceae bacterium]|nr:helical backbone metal receptor [Lachnospiraceae bacterium]
MKHLFKSVAVACATVIFFGAFSACGVSPEVLPDPEEVTQTSTIENEAENNDLSSDSANGAGSTDSSTGAVSTDSSTGNLSVSETVYPLTISDSNGKSVTIEAEPERIVSIAPNLTEMIYELGAGEKLVGRSDYCNYPAECLEVESIGDLFYPDMEKIISLKPDLILLSTIISEDEAESLEAVGVPILFLHDESSIEGVYDMVEILGRAINRNAEAAACADAMKANIADVAAKTAGLEKPRVYYVVSYGEYGDFTATGDTFTSQILELAGGINVAKDSTAWFYSLEQLVEADPEYIILPDYMKEDFCAAENYKDLTAVKEGRVIVFDTDMLDRQGIRNDDAVVELAKIFHPEAF